MARAFARAELRLSEPPPRPGEGGGNFRETFADPATDRFKKAAVLGEEAEDVLSHRFSRKEFDRGIRVKIEVGLQRIDVDGGAEVVVGEEEPLIHSALRTAGVEKPGG